MSLPPPSSNPAVRATPEQQAAVDTYAELMAEVRERTEWIEAALKGQTTLPEDAVAEFCMLQFRYVCEVIGLACLVAHGDLGPKSLRSDYSADRIVGALGKLHSDFFPIPVTVGPQVQDEESGRKGALVLHGPESPFTKDDLRKLYAVCLDRLHRGSVKQLLNGKRRPYPTHAELKDWLHRMVAALVRHHIPSQDRQWIYLCNLADGQSVSVRIYLKPREGGGGEDVSLA